MDGKAPEERRAAEDASAPAPVEAFDTKSTAFAVESESATRRAGQASAGVRVDGPLEFTKYLTPASPGLLARLCCFFKRRFSRSPRPAPLPWPAAGKASQTVVPFQVDPNPEKCVALTPQSAPGWTSWSLASAVEVRSMRFDLLGETGRCGSFRLSTDTCVEVSDAACELTLLYKTAPRIRVRFRSKEDLQTAAQAVQRAVSDLTLEIARAKAVAAGEANLGPDDLMGEYRMMLECGLISKSEFELATFQQFTSDLEHFELEVATYGEAAYQTYETRCPECSEVVFNLPGKELAECPHNECQVDFRHPDEFEERARLAHLLNQPTVHETPLEVGHLGSTHVVLLRFLYEAHYDDTDGSPSQFTVTMDVSLYNTATSTSSSLSVRKTVQELRAFFQDELPRVGTCDHAAALPAAFPSYLGIALAEGDFLCLRDQLNSFLVGVFRAARPCLAPQGCDTVRRLLGLE